MFSSVVLPEPLGPMTATNSPGSHRLLDQPTTDQLQGLAFPGLLLAPVLDQLRGAEAQAEGAEAATGVDRGQLPVVADQHHLSPGLLGVVEEGASLRLPSMPASSTTSTVCPSKASRP